MPVTVNNLNDLKNEVALGGTIHVDDRESNLIDITSPVVATKPVKVIGGNFRVNEGIGFDIRSSNVGIREARFRGLGTGAEYNSGNKYIYGQGESLASPIEDVRVIDCDMVGSTGDNIWFKWVNQPKIRGNNIHDYLYSGIMMLSCDGITVTENSVYDAVMRSPIVNTYGIATSDVTNTEEARARNSIIANNLIYNQPWEGIDTHGGKGMTITGNILNNCVRGIALVVGNEKRIIVPNGCVVTGNYLDGMGSPREGISFFGRPYTPADAVVTGNMIKGYANPIFSSYYNRGLTSVASNNTPHVSWTPITLNDGWSANGNYRPEFMVDGDIVFLRGMVIPSSGAPTTIGNIPSAYAPSSYTFMSVTKAAYTGSSGIGQVSVTNLGAVNMLYRNTNDSYSYAIDGSYRMV